MRISLPSALIIALLLILAGYACSFTVAQNELAVRVSADGAVIQSDIQPGLHFVNPVGQHIKTFDKRIVSRDIAEDKYQTSDGQQLRVSLYVRWKIADIAQYCKSVDCDEDRIAEQITVAAKKGFREMAAKRVATQVVAMDAADFNTEVAETVAKTAAAAGVKLVDLQVLNIALPGSYNDSVFAAMQSYFRQSATQVRAKGDADAREMVSQADRQKSELLVNAHRDAAIVRGDADAKAAAMYAAASARNPEFFSFYRSMQSYRDSLGRPDDVLVISPDSDFFKYFNKPTAR
jgi:membrane protease subunit HflC